MRIGINALFLIPGGVGGSEIYMRAMIRALAEVDSVNTYFVFRNAETTSDLVPDAPNFIDCPQAVRAVSRPARIAFEQTFFLRSIARCKLDVLLNGGYTAPILCTIPMLTIVYDMQYRINPQYARWFDRPFWDVLMPLSAHRSRGIIAISDAAEKQILQYYPWSRGRTTVVTHGIDADFTSVAQRRDREPERDDLFLAVSTLHPHKNLDTLIRAFAPIEARHPTYRLVVCGLKGFETERLLALRDELGLTRAVAFTGWIPRAELLAYFVRAKAFVFPSKFEGFGIPVLEALTAGLPIVCSDIAPLREIAGDCATFFDPLDERALENALENAIASAPSSDRIAKSRTRAARFTWTASAIKLRSALLAAATRAAT